MRKGHRGDVQMEYSLQARELREIDSRNKSRARVV